MMASDSTNPDVSRLFQESANYYDRGEFEKAVILLTAILKERTDFVPALVRRGMILAEMERFDEAGTDFERAIQLDRRNGLAYFGRGWVRGNLGDPQGEIDDARRGLALDPENEHMYYRRIGHGLGELKRYPEALDAYNHSLSLVPTQLGTLYNRALCYVELKRYAEAIADFDRVLDRNPEWAWPLCWRGWVYYQLGETDRALIDYTRALYANPRYDLAYLRRARVYLDRGETERAAGDLRHALEVTSNADLRREAEERLKQIATGT